MAASIKAIYATALLVLIGLLPLLRVSLDDPFLSRDTKVLLVSIGVMVVLFFFLYHSRVHVFLKRCIPLLVVFLLSAFSMGIFPLNSHALFYWIIAIFFGALVWEMRTQRIISRSVLAATLVGCIGIYSQWGIAQFIVQHDLGLHSIDESRLAPGIAGVASFTIGTEKRIRAYGPFPHPNNLGGAVVLGAILLCTMRPTSKQYAASIALTLALGGILSFSRAALVALGIVFLIFLLQSNYRAMLVCIFIPLAVFIPLFIGRSIDPHGVALEDRVQGVEWFRELLTPTALIRGYGIGNYEPILEMHLVERAIPHNSWDIAPIHSAPLLVFIELGGILFGVLAVMVGLFFFQYRSWILVTLVPPLVLDHYFVTSLGSLLSLITCVILVVQYKRGYRTY